MDKKDYLLGSILLSNLILNTKALQSAQEINSTQKDTSTTFSKLLPEHIYPRLISDTDFLKLSEQDKSNFLFLAKEQEGKIDKYDLYTYEMQLFSQEAHNRSAQSLGIKPTMLIPCEFSKSKGIADPNAWLIYDVVNGNMYANAEKDYSISRPSFLLENINAATRQHSIYQNIFTALTNPQSLNDREYFLALTTALKTYVYQDLKENAYTQYLIEMNVDYSTPTFIEQTLYGFEKTRQDFQSVGLYGGKLREDLRRNESIYHEYLKTELVVNSMTNMEDIFAYFKQSPLNEQSNGFLYEILSSLEKQTAHAFYNSLGADMAEGQSLTDYINELEVEMFDRCGIPMPTDDELEDFMDDYTTPQETDNLEEDEYEDDYPESYEDLNSKEIPNYKPMESVLPCEDKIDNISELPFHKYANQSSTSVEDLNQQ